MCDTIGGLWIETMWCLNDSKDGVSTRCQQRVQSSQVFLRIDTLATSRWCHIDSVLAIRRQNTMKPCQIGSGLGNQCG